VHRCISIPWPGVCTAWKCTLRRRACTTDTMTMTRSVASTGSGHFHTRYARPQPTAPSTVYPSHRETHEGFGGTNACIIRDERAISCSTPSQPNGCMRVLAGGMLVQRIGPSTPRE